MSRHANADIIRRGYEDQRDGKVDPVLAEEDSTRGLLYRTGLRERRRAEYDGVMRDGIEFAGPAEVYVNRGLESFARETESKPLPVVSSGPGGAFSEPVPGARKPRKAKPADEGQASLF